MSLMPNNNRKMFDAFMHVMPLLTTSESRNYAEWTAAVPLDGDFIALHYSTINGDRETDRSRPVRFVAETEGTELEIRFGDFYTDDETPRAIKPGIRQRVEAVPDGQSDEAYRELIQPGHLDGLVVRAARASGIVVVQGLVDGHETSEEGLTGNIEAAQLMLNACQWALTHNQPHKFRVPYMEEILPYRF